MVFIPAAHEDVYRRMFTSQEGPGQEVGVNHPGEEEDPDDVLDY